MHNRLLIYIMLFLGNWFLLPTWQSTAQDKNPFQTGRLLHLELGKRSALDRQCKTLEVLATAQYLPKRTLDSLMNAFLLLENEIMDYYTRQSRLMCQKNSKDISLPFRKRKKIADSLLAVSEERVQLTSTFSKQLNAIALMKETCGNESDYSKLKRNLELFPFKLNTDHYFQKAEELHRLNEWWRAGKIFFKLTGVPDKNVSKGLANTRLTEIENIMMRLEKEKLMGQWKHFDRKEAGYGRVGYQPFKLKRVVEFDEKLIRLIENDTCTVQSIYTLQPVFLWEAGDLRYNLHIKNTDETWNLSIPEYKGNTLNLWVTYPPPKPYNTMQTVDVYEKEPVSRPALVVKAN